MNSFANIPFSFDKRRETLFMEHIQVVASTRTVTILFHTFSYWNFIFYLAALIHYETKITKKTTRFCLPISPEEKLAITLRFLATGETRKSLMYR